MKLIQAIFWALLLFISTLTGGANYGSTPVGDPIYPYLERMESLGYLEHLLSGIKPFHRSKIAKFLKILKSKEDQLTKIDREMLYNYLLDYRYEIDDGQKYHKMDNEDNWYSPISSLKRIEYNFFDFFTRRNIEEQNYVAMWEDGVNSFYFNYERSFSYEKRSDDLYRTASWDGYYFRGGIGDDFAYRLHVSLQAFRGDRQYALEHPLLKKAWSLDEKDLGAIFGDRTQGEIAYHGLIDIQFAQQEVEWGYGESGKLILSSNPEPYPYLALSKNWGWGKFMMLHGKLQSFPQDTLIDHYLHYPDKWLAAQRLEIYLFPWLTIGMNENFIYGNRYAEWAYLIPFNFYRATQHKLRDRDNATISLDMQTLPWKGAKLYGAIFLDEFKLSKLGSNWFGNKQAYSAGFSQQDPFQLENSSITLEYTAIMPWVYTHKYRINAYTSDYQSLGHWAGPNSQVLYAHIQKRWSRRLNTGLVFQQWKHGENPENENIGADILKGRNILLGTQTQPKETRIFLEGVPFEERFFRCYIDYEWFNGFYLSGKYSNISLLENDIRSHLNEFYIGARLFY
jgi:hypothetical protein